MKVYVGNIPESLTERELEDEFSKFGKLISVWVARKPPGFAFIEFDEIRDAEDAVKDLDDFATHVPIHRQERMEGRNIKNQPASGKGRLSPPGQRGRDFGTLKCYCCGQIGHFARDCIKVRRSGGMRRGGYGNSRSRSRSPPRRRYRSPLRSRGYRSLSRSLSPRRR